MRILFFSVMTLCINSVLAQASNTISADDGDILITPLLHASAQIEYKDLVIQIDPWSSADLSNAKAADLILITDDPGHHMDPAAITQLRKPGAPVILTAKANEQFSEGTVLANGESDRFAGILVEAVGAYDMTPGEPYHPRGEANGYVITLGGKRLFLAGVGECVPEIQALQAIDVAFMPLNLPVDRMRPIPLAECLKTFMPEIVYVNHYNNPYVNWLANPQSNSAPNPDVTRAIIRDFTTAIAGLGIEFRDAIWYPPLLE